MITLVRAELLKLRTTRLFTGLLLAAAAIAVFGVVVQLTMGYDSSPTANDATTEVASQADLRTLLDVSGITTLFALVLGTAAISGEVRHRTIATTFLVTPSRRRVVAAKVLAYVVAGIVLAVVVEAVATGVALGWLGITGEPVPFGAHVAAGLALIPVATGFAAGFGVGIGAAVPNQLAAVLVAIGWVTLAEQLLGGLVSGLGTWLPFWGASAAITGANAELGALAGAALFAGYVAVVGIAGMQVTASRDVT